jgi:hypothetical protein
MRLRQVFVEERASNDDVMGRNGNAETASICPLGRYRALVPGLCALNRRLPAVGIRDGSKMLAQYLIEQ